MFAIIESKNADTKGKMENTDTTYLRGIKLYSILSGVMIATFLISLDVSIIATVSQKHPSLLTNINRNWSMFVFLQT